MIENIIIGILSLILTYFIFNKFGDYHLNESYRAWFIQSEALDNQNKENL